MEWVFHTHQPSLYKTSSETTLNLDLWLPVYSQNTTAAALGTRPASPQLHPPEMPRLQTYSILTTRQTSLKQQKRDFVLLCFFFLSKAKVAKCFTARLSSIKPRRRGLTVCAENTSNRVHQCQLISSTSNTPTVSQQRVMGRNQTEELCL